MKRPLKHIALYPLFALIALLAACNPTVAPSPAAQSPTPDAISIVDAVARPSPMAGGNGAVYLTVTNGHADPVQLSEVASPAAARVEIHETVQENDVMRMVHQPDGFTVPPNGSLVLSPGGKHIMLVDLVDALAVGDTIEVTFYFTHHAEADEAAQEAITLTVTVAEPDSPDPMPGDDEDEAHDH